MSDFPEKNEFLAKTAEQAERYEEMVDYMKKVCEGLASDQGLTIEQRNLLSVAYKNVVGSRRAAWRIISSIESRTAQSSDDDKAALCGQYREDVEKELEDVSSGGGRGKRWGRWCGGDESARRCGGVGWEGG